MQHTPVQQLSVVNRCGLLSRHMAKVKNKLCFMFFVNFFLFFFINIALFFLFTFYIFILLLSVFLMNFLEYRDLNIFTVILFFEIMDKNIKWSFFGSLSLDIILFLFSSSVHVKGQVREFYRNTIWHKETKPK